MYWYEEEASTISQERCKGCKNEIISFEKQKADHQKNQTRINFRSLAKEKEEVLNASKRKSNDKDTVKETEAKKLRKEEQSIYFETDADEVNELCSICSNDHPPGKAKKIKWIDCDVREKWAHEVCSFDSFWYNIRKNSWLCDKDK